MGGNVEKFFLGLGKYITPNFTVHGGLSRTWANFFNAKGQTSFYIGVGFTYKF